MRNALTVARNILGDIAYYVFAISPGLRRLRRWVWRLRGALPPTGKAT
jgi:hypothetical protein